MQPGDLCADWLILLNFHFERPATQTNLGDLRFMIALFAACLLAGYTAHRIAKFTPLRRMAPDWESWSRKRDFPMGLPLASTLSIYLLLGALGGV